MYSKDRLIRTEYMRRFLPELSGCPNYFSVNKVCLCPEKLFELGGLVRIIRARLIFTVTELNLISMLFVYLEGDRAG